MLAVALLSVNALACTPARLIGPERETRPWPAHLLVPGLAPSAADTLAREPVRLWSTVVGRGLAGPPALGDSVIVVQATDPHLVAIARASGKRLWSTRVDGLGTTGPLLGPDAVYTATASGQVSAFSLKTGRAAWHRSIDPVVGPLVLTPNRVFTAAWNGRVYALNRASGVVLWRQDLETTLRTGPTRVGPYLVVASDDSLMQIDSADGHRTRTVSARGLSVAPPAVTGDLLIYSSPDGFIAAYDAATLERRWIRETHQPVMGSPVVARDTVFAVTIGGSIQRIPLAAPGDATRIELGVTVRAAPAPLAEGLLVATVAGEVLWISGDSPTPRWQIRVDGPIEQPPIVDRGLLVFADGRGRIHAWK